jgi:hypothetical protein
VERRCAIIIDVRRVSRSIASRIRISVSVHAERGNFTFLRRYVQALAGEGTNLPGTTVNRISSVRLRIRVLSKKVAGRTPRSPTRSSSPERHMERTLYFCATLSGAEIRRSGTRVNLWPYSDHPHSITPLAESALKRRHKDIGREHHLR